MKVGIAGGGTGGHVYPAIAVVESLSGVVEHVEITFVGTGRGLEKGIIGNLGYRMRRIISRPLPSRKNASFVFSLLCATVGFVQSLVIILRERFNVVIGTGGYASGPFVFAASVLGVPTLLIEPNSIPGRTTVLLARFVDEVALGFRESVRHFSKGTNLRVTGIPVRPRLLGARKTEGMRIFGFDPKKKTVFVFGGSRGASSINRAFVEAAEILQGKQEVQFLVQTGHKDYEYVSRALDKVDLSCKVYPYIDDIGCAYGVSELAVCRAGAATISELTACGLPSILIPYPHATWSHQEANARILETKGAAIVIKDEELTGKLLAQTIVNVISDPTTMGRMSVNSKKLARPDASGEIASRLVELATAKGRLAKLAAALGELCSVR
jgi:UDP-N-acetylglucosamine--N-acetylmuramyl-(pentapeptide) pyrophosphoryl-undecaprenol N-acetylglucosamine transferase